MAFDYIFEGAPPPSVPQSPALGLDNGGNILYVSSKSAGWIPIGGGLGGGPVIQATAEAVNQTSPTNISIVAAKQVMYAVSLNMETTGTAASGHTVVATLNWTSPLNKHSQPFTLRLDQGILVAVETFPIFCAASTPISVTFSYGGGATNDPYAFSLRIVEMP
jgi:hypothetical protein